MVSSRSSSGSGQLEGFQRRRSRTPPWHQVLIQSDQEDRDQAIAGNGKGRLVIQDVRVSQRDVDVQTEVQLRHGDRTLTGQASGAATPRSRLRAASEAAAHALQQLLGEDIRLEILSLDVDDGPGTGDRVTVVVELLTPALVETLLGIALTRHGLPETAAVRAVLDAVNRLLPADLS